MMRAMDERAAPTLDEQIAVEALGEAYNEHWHRFTSDNEAAERLVEWLHEHSVAVVASGTTLTFWRGRERLFSQSGDAARIALARGVLRLAREFPQAIGWRSGE